MNQSKGARPLSITAARDKPHLIHLAFATALLFSAAPGVPLMAQGLEAEGAVDAIVGSDINTEQEAVAADEERIVAAIEQTRDNIAEVRKRFNIDRVDIVFLPDLAEEETAVDAKMEEFAPEISELQTEIQGSAIFYHAINSRRVLVTDVIAIEFDDRNGATIFVAGAEPGTGLE